MIETDYLVIGSGLAGLYFALRAAEHGRVIVATKRAPADTNTAYAQGGVAGVLDPDDSFEAHVDDTLRVGDGLCHRDVVELCVREAPEHILRARQRARRRRSTATPTAQLRARPRGRPHRAPRRPRRGHHRRAIQRALLARVARARRRITMLADHMAIDLLTTAKYGGPNAVFGAYVLDQTTGAVEDASSRAPTVLATGGAGKVYLYTTNPDVATGDGVAMAYRAGARVANMEFFQFHPTCLYHPQAKSFLITRGAARRGRHPAAARRRPRSWRATTR